MKVLIFFLLPGIIGAILRLRKVREIPAWLLTCLVIPAIIIANEYVPHQGGASFWPIALVIGGFCGAISGGLGVVIASFYLKRREKLGDKPVGNNNQANP